MEKPKINYLKVKDVPFFKHIFYEYYIYVDSPDYKADYIIVSNCVKGKILRTWINENEEYRLIEVRIRKYDAELFEDCMDQLIKKQLISGNTDYLDRANFLCNQLLELLEDK